MRDTVDLLIGEARRLERDANAHANAHLHQVTKGKVVGVVAAHQEDQQGRRRNPEPDKRKIPARKWKKTDIDIAADE